MNIDEFVIWPPYEAFYIQSMLFNSSSAFRSIARLESIFEKLPERPTHDDALHLPAKQILNEFQNLVLQSGALSRYFWPARNNYETRGKYLREVFNLNESNPLFNRDLRNALEHFDERLDEYVSSGIVGYVFPEYVGVKPKEEGVPGHFFRAYFIDSGEFRLLNKEFKMQPLADELLSIHRHLIELDENGGRLCLQNTTQDSRCD